jgi:ferredoxin
MVSDAEQFAPKFDSSRVIRIGGYGRRESWGKALVAGRAAAMEMLPKTQPGKVQPIPQKRRGAGSSKVGIFICSCNGTLNENGRMTDMIGPLEKIQNVAHVEIVVSACHPEKGRRIEEVISKKGLDGALIASCVCCHLDFACESCNDQRIRLKKRLFRVMGYEPKDIALVNIKETCLLPYTENSKRGAEMAIKVIRSGLWQLREHKAWSLEDNRLHHKALVLGATEAGIAAAKGLKAQFLSVGLMEGQQVEKRVHRELRDCGIELICPVKPVCLNGHHGRFTVIVEKGGPLKSGALKKNERELLRRTLGGRQYLDSQAIGEDPRYQMLEADIIVLGRKEFKDIPYIRDAFSQHDYAGGKKAFGSLETRIPGVYLASWSQAQSIPDEALGRSAASQAIEVTSEAAEPSEFLVAHVDPELCRGCGKCADICPEGAVHLEEITRGTASARIEPWLCTGCGNCIGECPTGAIRLPESEQAYFEKVINAFLE